MTLEDVQQAHDEWQTLAVTQFWQQIGLRRRPETPAERERNRIAEEAAYARWRRAYHTYRMEEYGESY